MYILWTCPVKIFKATEITTDENILVFSWYLATKPKLYQELVPNPYSPKSLQAISERFPNSKTVNIIRAFVLAEPEGRYDVNFRFLGTTQQEEELRKQRDNSVEISERLVRFCNKYANELSRLPKEFVYDNLSRVAFETDDLKKIEQKYTQNQRRNFKLSIVNFIEYSKRLELHHQQKDDDHLTAIRVSGKNRVSGRPLLQIAFAVFSFILMLYLAISMYEEKNEQKQAPSIVENLEANKQILGIETREENQGFPVRLIIPTINVDASIQRLGSTPKGEMEVPNNILDVGWFNPGPRPGESGSAVIAGHLNGENEEVGVFTNLHKLKEGDRLYIEDDKGTFIVFAVREKHIYDPGYADDVFSSSDGAHLNLVTCDGVWDEGKKSYTKRLVVFTDITD